MRKRVLAFYLLFTISMSVSIQIAELNIEMSTSIDNSLFTEPLISDTDAIPTNIFNSKSPNRIQSFQTPKIFFIVNDHTNPQSSLDVPFYNYVTNSLGYDIDYYSDTNSYDLTNYDAILISQSVAVGSISTIVNSSIPIFTLDNDNFLDLNLGEKKYTFTTKTDISIISNNHDITSGFTIGTHTIYNQSGTIYALENYASVPPGSGIIEHGEGIGGPAGKQATLLTLEKDLAGYNTLINATERRAFFGGGEGDRLNDIGWTLFERTLRWILYDYEEGIASVEVNVSDFHDKVIDNAKVTLTNSTNELENWDMNTTVNGKATFTEIPYGKYNITVEFRDLVNDSLTNLEFVGDQLYNLETLLNYSITIPGYLDNSPPEFADISYEQDNHSFSVHVLDESNIVSVNLNVTVRDIDDSDKIILDGMYVMVSEDEQIYYNDTAMDGLAGNLNVTYNITALDSAMNSKISNNYQFLLGDIIDPNIHSYNATDNQDGTINIVANVSDDDSSISLVKVRVNDSIYEMDYLGENIWSIQINALYNQEINYTVFQVLDTAGNEAGPAANKTITPTDSIAPQISDIVCSIEDHEKGYVECSVVIDDWNDYQSGVNQSSVYLNISINGINYNITPNRENDLYFFNYTFNWSDVFIYQYIAADVVGNTRIGDSYGPYLINDTSPPTGYANHIDYGNGSVTLYAIVFDWPSNISDVTITFTQNYVGLWKNITLIKFNSTYYSYTITNFSYTNRNIWYYLIASDSLQNIYAQEKVESTYFLLIDTVTPEVDVTTTFSEVTDGEFFINARVFDSFGSESPYITEQVYINITAEGKEITYLMNTHLITNLSYTGDLPYNTAFTVEIYAHDPAGNLANYTNSFINVDNSKPAIDDFDLIDHQNGSLTLWIETFEGMNGSGIDTVTLEILSLITPVPFNSLSNRYEITLGGYKPGDSIYYRFNVTDNANNYNLTLIENPFYILDKVDPIIISTSYNATLVSPYKTQLTFYTIVNDEFGSIENVTIIISYYNLSQLLEFSHLMVLEGQYFTYTLDILCQTTFNYTIIATDGTNIVIKNKTNQSTLDYYVITGFDYQIVFNEDPSEVGKIHAIFSFIYEFTEIPTVILTINDISNDNMIFNQSLTFNNSYYVSTISTIPFATNFTLKFTIQDSGSYKNFYNPQTFEPSIIYKMEGIWCPIVEDTDIITINSTTFLIWANISSFGHTINEVWLNYTFNPFIVGLGSGYTDSSSVLMENNGTHYIAYLSFHERGSFLYSLKVINSVGMETEYESEIIKEVVPFIPITTQEEDFLGNIVTAALTVFLIGSVLLISTFVIQRRNKIKEKELKGVNSFYDIFNIQAIICRNVGGIALYNENFIFSDQDGDLIAGLSSALSNLISDISKQNLKVGQFDLIEREEFGILTHQGIHSAVIFISTQRLSDKTRELIKKTHILFEEKLGDSLNYPLISDVTQNVIKDIFYENIPLGYHKPLLLDQNILNANIEAFKGDEKKCISLIPKVTFLVNHPKVFFALSLIDTLINNGIKQKTAILFLEKISKLKVIRNLTEVEESALNVPRTFQSV